MEPIALGRLRVSAVVERAGPTRPTWLLPDAGPEAVERHRGWLAPHFLDDRGRLLQTIQAFVVEAPGLRTIAPTSLAFIALTHASSTDAGVRPRLTRCCGYPARRRRAASTRSGRPTRDCCRPTR